MYGVVFTVSGKPIKIVDTFKYLGRVTAKTDIDEAAVLQNREQQASRKWVSMRMVLTRDGVKPKTMAVFYRTVVLYTLFYGSASWVLTQDLMRQLRSFHQRCCRGLARDFIRQHEITGEWICPNSDKVLQKVGCQSIEEYIQRRRDTIMEYAKTRNIYEECKNSEIASKLKRPKDVNIVKFSCYFFSSDHGGISTADALATPVLYSGN